MAKQTIRHGAQIDVATPEEVAAAVNNRGDHHDRVRVRQVQSIQLDAGGAAKADVYSIPAGFEFDCRRVTLDLSSASDPSTGNVPINVAGKFVRYLRSGQRIEYSNPQSPAGVPSIPGVQSWAREQGPYLRNGEVFQVEIGGLTANATLEIVLEGILYRLHRR